MSVPVPVGHVDQQRRTSLAVASLTLVVHAHLRQGCGGVVDLAFLNLVWVCAAQADGARGVAPVVADNRDEARMLVGAQGVSDALKAFRLSRLGPPVLPGDGLDLSAGGRHFAGGIGDPAGLAVVARSPWASPSSPWLRVPQPAAA